MDLDFVVECILPQIIGIGLGIIVGRITRSLYIKHVGKKMKDISKNLGFEYWEECIEDGQRMRKFYVNKCVGVKGKSNPYNFIGGICQFYVRGCHFDITVCSYAIGNDKVKPIPWPDDDDIILLITRKKWLINRV
ncbi:MAG: hypothetical protein DRN20_03825, partial [Thermoplasmata archaeon]